MDGIRAVSYTHLPVCPTDAIKFIEREAAAYDEEAVKANMAKRGQTPIAENAEMGQEKMKGNVDGGQEKMNQKAEGDQAPTGGCPGMRARMLRKVEQNMTGDAGANKVGEVTAISSEELTSQLMQWPVQMKLVPTKAPYFDGANLLIAADCTAYALSLIHI